MLLQSLLLEFDYYISNILESVSQNGFFHCHRNYMRLEREKKERMLTLSLKFSLLEIPCTFEEFFLISSEMCCKQAGFFAEKLNLAMKDETKGDYEKILVALCGGDN
ncbi:hypothetical protein E2320_017254 [Naja naja]|nr:hypothetical protein E2320_017254 [Naja naja]